jgi:hypothetical protein
MTGFELFPEESKRQEDLSIREQYEQLLAREQAEQAAALDQRLSEINSSGDMSELLTSVQLKLSFISKFGATRYGALHAKHVKREGEKRAAERLTEKESKRNFNINRWVDEQNRERRKQQRGQA